MLHRRHKRLFLEQAFIFCRYFVYGTVIILLLGMSMATVELDRLVHPRAQTVDKDAEDLDDSPAGGSVEESDGFAVLRRG